MRAVMLARQAGENQSGFNKKQPLKKPPGANRAAFSLAPR